jgi:hypothetical protein
VEWGGWYVVGWVVDAPGTSSGGWWMRPVRRRVDGGRAWYVVVGWVVDAPGTSSGGWRTRLVRHQVGGGGVVVVVMRWHRSRCSGVGGGTLASSGGWWHG